jgi:hypothetical protein
MEVITRKANGAPDKVVISKNADGTIKTFKRQARTEWKILPPGRVLADNTAGAHLGFVLRVDSTLKLFQTLDTGGLNVKGFPPGSRGDGVIAMPAANGFHGGIFDDPQTDRVNPGSGHDPFRGVGVLEAIDKAAAEDLLKHVERLKQARPLGLTRLVLLRRGQKITLQNYWRFREPSQNWLIYASPLLPMYGKDPAHNFPISRCLWSLRDMPGRADVEAMWFFYVPQGFLGQAMMDAERDDNVIALARSAHELMRTKKPAQFLKYRAAGPAGGVKTDALLADFTVPVADATVEANGEVKIVATYKTSLTRKISVLHGLEGRYGTKAHLPLSRSFLRGAETDTSFPDYFRTRR